MQKNTIYISGPITGTDYENQKKYFEKIQKELESKGRKVINPWTLNRTDNGCWADYIIRDLRELKNADELMLLPDWEKSRGCRIEKLFAEGMGIPVTERIEKQ